MPEIDSELELALNYLDHNKDESLKRLFDILKPWPISWVDKNVKGGFGILLDDLIAGFVAGGIIFAILISI